jgi:hypothetical protein
VETTPNPKTETPGMCKEPEGPWKFQYTEVEGDCEVPDFEEILNFNSSTGDDPESVCGNGAVSYEASREPNRSTCEVTTYKFCEYNDGSDLEFSGKIVLVNANTIEGEVTIESNDSFGHCVSKLRAVGHPL